MKVFNSIALLTLTATLLPAALDAQQKDTASGQRIFATNCASCHGSDGRGGERAPSIATVRDVVSLADTDIEAIVKNGQPAVGMPPFGYLGDEKVGDVVAYLRILQGKGTPVKVTGDPKAGRALFYGKGACMKCHMVGGEGGFIAADLSTYGDGLSPAAVRRAIVDPERNLEPTSKVVEVYTPTGERISGLLRSEDRFSVALLTEDGRFRFYQKAKIASVRHTSHSIMPTDYESKLTNKELEDLVSFLITTASNPNGAESPVRKRRPKNDD
jgi:cytochrome c oxidase cbb3-type subunit III